MNYWDRHIGDIIRDTVSLTMLEDGAYNRLLDQYYQTERPLPLDKKMIYRLARATSAPERKACDFVMETFFRAEADGYHQKRCDAEIARYQEKQRKAQASANARWSKSDGNANGYANASQTHDADDMRTHCEGNAHQAPSTSTQTPSIKTQSIASGSSDFLSPAAISVSLIGWERERHKAARGVSASNQQVIDLAELRVSAAELRVAYDSAVADRLATEDPNPINAGFIAVFVNKIRNPPKPRPKADDWYRSDAGISRKAAELGLTARGGETYANLRERCEAKIRQLAQGAAA